MRNKFIRALTAAVLLQIHTGSMVLASEETRWTARMFYEGTRDWLGEQTTWARQQGSEIWEGTRFRIGVYKNRGAQIPLVKKYYNVDKWNRVHRRVLIGEMPILERGDAEELVKAHNVKYVLSMQEKWEIATVTWAGHPVQQEYWTELGVTQVTVETPDHGGLKTSVIAEAGRYLDEWLNHDDGNILINCKSGHGRSVTAWIGHLLKTDHTLTVERAKKQVRMLRAVARPNEKQTESLQLYRAELQRQKS